MVTDVDLTVEYHNYWKKSLEHTTSLNGMSNMTLDGNSSGKASTSKKIDFEIPPYLFFYCALTIWTITPLNYTALLYLYLKRFLINRDYSTTSISGERLPGKSWTIVFLTVFNLTPEKASSFRTFVKVMIVFVPPFGILSFLMLMIYSVFIAYVQYPLFALRITIEELYDTLSKETRLKIECVVGKYKIIETLLMKMRAFCGMSILVKDDLPYLRMGEALCESLLQLLLSMCYIVQIKRFNAENPDEFTVFTSNNTRTLASMTMSFGSIFFAFNTYGINVYTEKYGKDFYKRVKYIGCYESMKLVYVFIVPIMALGFFVFLTCEPLSSLSFIWDLYFN